MPASTPEEEIANLRDRIEELETELAAARESDTMTELRRQLDEAQRELVALRAQPAPAPKPSRRRLDGFFEVEDTE